MASAPEITALLVSLVALVIAVFQVVQQYVGTLAVRNKIGPAAIGVWAKNNTREWSKREWKLRQFYLEPELTWEGVRKCLLWQRLEELKIISALDKYDVTMSTSVAVSSRGPRSAGPRRLNLCHRGDEAQMPVPHGSLSRMERHALDRYHEVLERRDSIRRTPCTATWYNMMCDLVGDPLDLLKSGGSDFDLPDSIPSALDNPTMHIHLSDLIIMGSILDMEITHLDVWKPAVNMAGPYCNITSQHQQSVGMTAWYSAKPNHVHRLQPCLPREILMLAATAQGYLKIGGLSAPITSWGYNSVELLFKSADATCDGEGWNHIANHFYPHLEGDDATSTQWGGRWNSARSPRVGLVLTCCGSPAVANSFPHRLIAGWEPPRRGQACKTAFRWINDGVGFVEAPGGFCSALMVEGVVLNDEYKLTNNWGAEDGGIRGWCMGSGAEFVKMVAPLWRVDTQSEHVPILPLIRPLLENGTVDSSWGRTYNSSRIKFSGRLYSASASNAQASAQMLLFTQVMLFDTFIARRVDLMMQGTADEAAVPVDILTAANYAQLAREAGAGGTGHKKSRSTFMMYYLARLADGAAVEENGMPVSVSCMSSPGSSIGPAGWAGMPGNANDWAMIDAVLTLRAVVMAARLELMYDTSGLLDLQDFDPVIRMA
ncbi:hypothetical protein B0H13DRAFT_1712826 [Mycena leptocephala]|nr:hypothetical protein B0H13DRAFT_1712826 [Mycena leptocephala]